jgi:lysozyme family protein
MEQTSVLASEYINLWDTCTINPSYESDLDWAIQKIKEGRQLYEKVSVKTGVPWYVVAVIHSLESSTDFSAHLHNGDPLTARTKNVPQGRPLHGTPPFTWEDSAIDALNYDGACGVRNWNLPTLFWFLEGFNGWGYRIGSGRKTTPAHRSAYLFSGTNHYEKGKYIADGSFDPEAISAQVGCMALLKALEKDGLISISPSAGEELNEDRVGSVQGWQHLLNGCGYLPSLIVNGHLDAATIQLTKTFQADLGLDVSGNVDLSTWKAGLRHKKLPGWQQIVPPLSSIKNPLPRTIPKNPRNNGNVGNTTRRLHDFYSKENNYNSVYDNVMSWYGTTSNGCTAFVSTALRLIGYDVPIEVNADGYNISLWTAALSGYLEDKGWKRSTLANNMLPGDIVFTDDGGYDDDIPCHVYVFSKWHDSSKEVAWVIDNQDFTHRRNIYAGDGIFNFSPFAYFLRD